jgi:hypothetical protein
MDFECLVYCTIRLGRCVSKKNRKLILIGTRSLLKAGVILASVFLLLMLCHHDHDISVIYIARDPRSNAAV